MPKENITENIVNQLDMQLEYIANTIDGLPFVKNFIRDGEDIQFTDDYILMSNLIYCTKLLKMYSTINEAIRVITNAA